MVIGQHRWYVPPEKRRERHMIYFNVALWQELKELKKAGKFVSISRFIEEAVKEKLDHERILYPQTSDGTARS